MLIFFEILIIIVLSAIVVTLILDETRKRSLERHPVKVKTYWDGINRRRAVRHNATLDVLYKINKNVLITVASHNKTKTRDISTQGIGLVLSEKMRRRMILSLEIKLGHSNEPVKAKAAVMWCRESVEDEEGEKQRLFYTGLKFIRFDDRRQEQRLFDYIHSLEQDTSESYVAA